MSEDDLLYLLEQSRARNLEQNVTGMLLYLKDMFLQVLEGEKKDVDEIYKAIVKDKRNTGNIVIEQEVISERTFPDWSMGFRRLTKEDKDDVAGYTEFLEKEMTPEQIANKSDEVVSLLYLFKKTNI